MPEALAQSTPLAESTDTDAASAAGAIDADGEEALGADCKVLADCRLTRQLHGLLQEPTRTPLPQQDINRRSGFALRAPTLA